MEVLVSEILQILGAVLILGAFALLQFRTVSQQSYPYLLLNLIGSTLLAVVVLTSHQWGLLLLEGAWALIALWGIIMHMSAALSARFHPGDTPSCVPVVNSRTATVERRPPIALRKVALYRDMPEAQRKGNMLSSSHLDRHVRI
jgi:hypothetical protein